jgi:replicative DNA helicase
MIQPPKYGPHDIQLEQELLGCLLVYGNGHQLVTDVVRVEDFFEPLHQEIFDIISKLSVMGKPATPVTVKSFLPSDFLIAEGMTVSQYLARLAASATTLATAKEFATMIRDLSDYRAIINVVETTATMKGIDWSPQDAATQAIDMLDGIVAKRSNEGALPSLTMPQAISRAVEAAAVAYQNEGKMVGIPFGLADLDAKLLGAQKGQLIILAGRPGMCKTGFSLSIARNMAHAGFHGVFFSLEMGDVELSQRMISDEMFEDGRMTYWQIRSGKFHESVFQRIADAGHRLSELPLVIEQQPGLGVSQIASKARQHKRRGKLDFLIIDYLGLMVSSDRYSGNKVNEIGEITAGLKALAKELALPIILLCQLNRKVEERDDKRPRLADLRDSGNIEQDADVVIMLYRKAYYLERSEPPAGSAEYMVWQTEMEQCCNELLCLIEKQRAGPVGTVKCFIDVGCNAIRSWSHGEMS